MDTFEPFPHFATSALHVGQEPEQWKSSAVIPPISMSTTFKQFEPAKFAVGQIYSLLSLPSRPPGIERPVFDRTGQAHRKLADEIGGMSPSLFTQIIYLKNCTHSCTCSLLPNDGYTTAKTCSLPFFLFPIIIMGRYCPNT